MTKNDLKLMKNWPGSVVLVLERCQKCQESIVGRSVLISYDFRDFLKFSAISTFFADLTYCVAFRDSQKYSCRVSRQYKIELSCFATGQN